MTDLKYPEWQLPYQQALLELDQCKLSLRIALAEDAICSRLGLIRTVSQNIEEVQALRDAQSGLSGLRNEVLRFNASQMRDAPSHGLSFLVN
jgi:hypothetical protein